jgi:integrase
MNGALLHVDLPPLQLLRRLSHKLLSTGLRVSEIMALKWGDFEALTLLVQRAIVHGRVDEVKTDIHAITFRLMLV